MLSFARASGEHRPSGEVFEKSARVTGGKGLFLKKKYEWLRVTIVV
jgi:hypothetical protein